jgi:hypothetical protein
MIYGIYLTEIGLTPGGSSTMHIYTQTIHRIQRMEHPLQTNNHNNKKNNQFEKCGPCPIFTSYTLAFALQLRKKHGKTSVRAAARTSQTDTV